jgi:hypothetical protein
MLSEAAHMFFEALDYHDLDMLATILSDDFQLSGNVTQPLDRDGMLALMGAYFTAFSDISFNFTEAEQTDNIVKVKYHVTATHDGNLDLTPLGVAISLEPTEQKIDLPESRAEYHFSESDQLTAQIVQQAAGAAMSDLLSQLGIEMPPVG